MYRTITFLMRQFSEEKMYYRKYQIPFYLVTKKNVHLRDKDLKENYSINQINYLLTRHTLMHRHYYLSDESISSCFHLIFFQG